MMTKLLTLLIATSGLLLPAALLAIEFDEVRNFEDVFVISAQAPGRDRVEVSWKIEDEYYLYNNKFLRFTSASDGVVLGEPQVPQGEIEFDELLGEEVEKYHDSLTITVPLVTALGVGLASSIQGRNPMVDGFGLIAFASLTPMIFVMGYGMII